MKPANPSVLPWLRCLQFLLPGLLCLTQARSAPNQKPAASTEPAQHHSYVRSHDRKFVAVDTAKQDWGYSDELAKVPFGTIDVLMTQCFGGGFRNDIADKLTIAPRHFTFTSASAWSEPAFSKDDANPAIGYRHVENYTRAWREAVQRRPGVGLLRAYELTLNGDNLLTPALAPDPFATGAAPLEHSEFESADALADDTRSLANLEGGRRFAILVAWSKADERHGINIARVYDTLRNTYGLQPWQIVVLYGDKLAANLGPYRSTRMDGETGFPIAVEPTWTNRRKATDVDPNEERIPPAIPVNKVNSKANWLKAIQGQLFTDMPAEEPPIHEQDSLFIYNTGHGGHTGIIQGKVLDLDNDGVKNDVRYVIPDVEIFHRSAAQGSMQAANNLINDDQHYEAQLSFAAPLANTIRLVIDGKDYGLFGNQLNTNITKLKPDQVTPIDLLVPAANTHYFVKFPPVRPPGQGAETVIELHDFDPLKVNPLVLLAALLDGGDQEAVVVVTPPPPAPAKLKPMMPAANRPEGFGVTLSGERNRSYALEYSTDLFNWSLLSNVVLSGESTNIVDPGAAQSPRRFYRAEQLDTGKYLVRGFAGEGGTVTPSGSVRVNGGLNFTLSATPAADHGIVGWSVDGEWIDSTNRTLRLTNIQADHTVVVRFALTDDLALSHTAEPAESMTLGTNLVYTLTVLNQGARRASGVTLSVALPTSVTYEQSNASQGSASVAGQTVTASLGDIEPNRTAVVTVTVVPQSAGDITATANVSANETDLDPDNNQSALRIRVVAP